MSKQQALSRGLVRIGIAVPKHVHERLQQLTEELGCSQSRIVEAIVSTMTVKSLQEAILAADELVKLEEVLHRRASSEMLRLVRGKTAGQIRQMTIAANEQINEPTQ